MFINITLTKEHVVGILKIIDKMKIMSIMNFNGMLNNQQVLKIYGS